MTDALKGMVDSINIKFSSISPKQKVKSFQCFGNVQHLTSIRIVKIPLLCNMSAKKGHLLHFEFAAATRQHVLWITSKCKDHCQSFNLPLAPKNTSRLVTPPGNACIKTISERLPWNPCLSTAAISRRHRHVCICDVGRGRLWFSVSCWPKRSPEIFCNLDSRAAHF